jgi:hypothetical protein
VTFVSSDYGIYGMNSTPTPHPPKKTLVIKENHQDLLFNSQLHSQSVIVNPQLAFDYPSLNHIGQKLVTMKVKDDLIRAITDLKKTLESEYSSQPNQNTQKPIQNSLNQAQKHIRNFVDIDRVN